MKKERGPSLVVVGSVGLDTIRTPQECRRDVLGGSVSFACAAASFFTNPGMVGVVGDDFPDAHLRLYRRLGIDTRGLHRAKGKTFRWSGVYERDMNNRRTLSTELNVFAEFSPQLPEEYRRSPFLFLANISPDLQRHVLQQMQSTRFVAADTMDLWIRTARSALRRLLQRVDLLTLNESEIRLLTGEENLWKAARAVLKWGPTYVLVKKGEHGAVIFSGRDVCIVPAYPLEQVRDPTGAGDSFAGAMMGVLASRGAVGEKGLREAVLYGCVVASFGVEAFGLEGYATLTRAVVERRVRSFRRMLAVH